MSTAHVPDTFEGIGYSKARGLPLDAIRRPVPHPGPQQVLIKTDFSSLNPLEYKLAELNFLGRVSPVILGFDLAGTIVEVGDRITAFTVGDEVAAMADPNGDGGWATGGGGGYALAREIFTTKRPSALPASQAAALPLCFLSACLGLQERVQEGDTVYIPGGGGGVGHLAVQLASRVLGARMVISSASKADTTALAKKSGANVVLDYTKDDIAAEIAKLTSGQGADVVFDITYSEQSYVDTAHMVRGGGKWIVLGVGPGKTTRTVETTSPVAERLASRHAELINVNLLRYFSDPSVWVHESAAFFSTALKSAMTWAVEKKVTPCIEKIIDSTPEAISAGLVDLKAGRAFGKTVVQVDARAQR